ncbi:Coenzyme F420 hydrogenase/dehydrogenase, beta subunit C-terminal domain [Candidatus Altiarchaeota archaeon]
MKEEVILKVEEKNPELTINKILIQLLEGKLVDAVLVPSQTKSGDSLIPTLVKDSKFLEQAHPLASVLQTSAAILVSNITRLQPSPKKAAVVLKPCEMRALVELVKLKQASLKNIITIGVECWGTFSVPDYKEISSKKEQPEKRLMGAARVGKDDEKIRTSCLVCEYPIPQNTDLAIGLLGLDPEKELALKANSKYGSEILEKLKVSTIGSKGKGVREKAIKDLIEKRKTSAEKMMKRVKEEFQGIDSLDDFYSACINCHNCMKVCPICYCRECFFESPTFDYPAEKYLQKLSKKGALRMPADKMLFHLGRMIHVSLSCVDCGLCEQACPADIALLKIYKAVGRDVRELFDYLPGRSPEEELPLKTFEPEELSPR